MIKIFIFFIFEQVNVFSMAYIIFLYSCCYQIFEEIEEKERKTEYLWK